MTGLPCDLHMFDSDHRPFSNASGQLANLWEEIYLKLYTSRAARASPEVRARQVQQLSSSLDRYAQKHGNSIPSNTSSTEELDPTKVELVYGFHVSQVLVLRCDRRNEKSQETMRETARKSLNLVLMVCKPPLATSRLALLSSIVGNYPMVAFFELVSHRLAALFRTGKVDEAAQADLALLRAVCEHLQMPSLSKLGHIFYTRLKLGLGWALDMLEGLEDALTSAASDKNDAVGRISRASSACHTNNPSSPAITELLGGCPIRLPSGDHQGHASLPPSRPGETTEFGSAEGLAERAGFGFFTPMDGTDTIDLTSRSLSSSRCDFVPPVSSCSMAPSQPELASDFMTGSSDWGNFNMEYFQETFSQEASWS